MDEQRSNLIRLSRVYIYSTSAEEIKSVEIFVKSHFAIFYDLQKRKNSKDRRKNEVKDILDAATSSFLHQFAGTGQGRRFLEDLFSSSLPRLSISPALMRVEEIIEPSSALTSSTAMIFAGFTPILARISLSNLPLL